VTVRLKDGVTNQQTTITFTWTVTNWTGQFQSQQTTTLCERYRNTTMSARTCLTSDTTMQFSVRGDGTIQSVNASTCLVASGANIAFATCNAAQANQQWTLPVDGTMRNAGLCITLPNGAASGTTMSLLSCGATPTTSMKWNLA
jgi:hypothetical protein